MKPKYGLSVNNREMAEAVTLLLTDNRICHIQFQYSANTFWGDYIDFYREIVSIRPDISWSLHAYNEINFAEPNPMILEAWMTLAQNTIDDAARINGAFVNFHFGGYSNEPGNYDQALKTARRTLHELSLYAQNKSIAISVENIFNTHSSSDYLYLGDKKEDFIQILKNSPGNIFICYDYGHGNINDLQRSDLSDPSSGLRINSLHIHDNDKISDRHYALGDVRGTINWPSELRLLKTSSFAGFLIFESYLSAYKSSLDFCLQYFQEAR